MLETPELLWQNLVRESVREVRYGMRPEERGIVQLVDYVLERAVALHASDIHLEPQEMRVRLRFRIDGILREILTMPANLGPAVTSRIKVMAGMDIAVHQQPQDGHILFQPKDRRIDIRVSSLPASAGEVIVMRLMDVSARLFSLDELGFSAEDTATLRELIHRPAGMIVLCGPMNSGKTSSLYAALTELNTESRNLVTLEDPIERILPGVNQVQIHPKAGMTFVAGLRAVLRQDVTGILLGEIRDEETAAMAVRIALTGHLLMTTIHTEDAVSALYRMLEMGIAPYLLAATLSGIVSQRLVRSSARIAAKRTASQRALTRRRSLRVQRAHSSTGAAAALHATAQATAGARSSRNSSCRMKRCARAFCRRSRGARWWSGRRPAACARCSRTAGRRQRRASPRGRRSGGCSMAESRQASWEPS